LTNSIGIGACARPTANGHLALGSTTYPLGTASTAGAIAGYICGNVNGTLVKFPYYTV